MARNALAWSTARHRGCWCSKARMSSTRLSFCILTCRYSSQDRRICTWRGRWHGISRKRSCRRTKYWRRLQEAAGRCRLCTRTSPHHRHTSWCGTSGHPSLPLGLHKRIRHRTELARPRRRGPHLQCSIAVSLARP